MGFRKIMPVVVILTSLSLGAGEAGVVKCPSKELSAHPFIGQELSVQVTELNGYKVFDASSKFSGRARVRFTIENSASQFQTFEPQDLSFVGKDGVQVFPVFERIGADDTPPLSLHLAPGARRATEYALTGRLLFPAKIYFRKLLVAEVTE